MGQAAFGAKTLEALLERGEEVVAAYSPPDGTGGRVDPVAALAREKDLPLYQPVRFRLPEVTADFEKVRPDLLIMAFVTPIIPNAFLEVPSLGTINYHPSLLPRHRGASAINWAIIMGDEKTGLTIFWPDGGIDTGPILLQKEVPIQPSDTTGSVYFDHLFPMGIEAILESVDLIRQGKAPSIAQDEAQATYEPPCDAKVAGIDWSKPGQEIFNLVRGCDPQPGAHSLWKSEKISFYGATFSSGGSDRESGEVLGMTENGLSVSTKDGTLEIAKVRTPDQGKIDAADFVAHSGIKGGDRFGR
jgi:methionyl-tRNA formyltransferase